jgi:hypothetical protein
MWTNMYTNKHISVSVFFFDYRWIWDSTVVWKNRMFYEACCLLHSQDQTNQLNCKPHYEYTTAKLVLSCLFCYKKKTLLTSLHFSFVSFSPEKKKHFSLHFTSGFPNLGNSCQLLVSMEYTILIMLRWIHSFFPVVVIAPVLFHSNVLLVTMEWNQQAVAKQWTCAEYHLCGKFPHTKNSQSSKSKSKSHYGRQSVGQSILVSGAHLGPATNFSFSLRFSFRQLQFVIL